VVSFCPTARRALGLVRTVSSLTPSSPQYRGLIEVNYFGPTTADTLEMLSLLTMVLECTDDLILRFCALPDVLPPYLCSHRCESLTPCHRQLSLSFAPSGFIALDGLTPLFESFSVPSVSCTTCSTAPSYLLLVTCKPSLRGCCGLFNGFGFSSLILVLCFWFFFSIFVVFRQNGFQSATRWVSSSGCCSFVFLGGFRFSSEIMCSLGLFSPFVPSVCHTAPSALQLLSTVVTRIIAQRVFLVSCTRQDYLRTTWVAPLATFSGLPELESPHPLPMLRGKVSCSFFSELKHDGTTPQLPTELQQVTTPSRGMDRLRTKTTKVLTSPATSQPLQFHSEEVVTLLNTRAQQETHSPLTVVRGAGTTHQGPSLSLQERLECGVFSRFYRMTIAARLRFVPGTAALVREGVLLFL
jgi:hypothetical protein